MTMDSEAETRGPGCLAGTPARRAGKADDDLLTFLQIAAHHFRAGAVADPERDLHRLQLAVGGLDPDAPARRTTTTTTAAASRTAARGGRRLRVVACALLGREDLADLLARRLAILLDVRLALLLGQTLDSGELAATLLEDRVELLLLRLVELVRIHEAFAEL